jgi:hypothetical protein
MVKAGDRGTRAKNRAIGSSRKPQRRKMVSGLPEKREEKQGREQELQEGGSSHQCPELA